MSFFDDVDTLVKHWKAQRDEAKKALKACGWSLIRQHPLSGMWRASRYVKDCDPLRMRATTAAELIRLCQEEAAPRLKAREERKAKAAAKKKDKVA